MELRRHYLGQTDVDTIYLGGGTPSLLQGSQLRYLIDSISNCYKLADDTEITLEANPDDLTLPKLRTLKEIGVNRLSIGIQSFENSTLKYLNRIHDATQALACLEKARSVGFDNLSMDLIYGIPSQSRLRWSRDLKQAIDIKPEHLSCYCLTIEENTVFGDRRRREQLIEVPDKQSEEEYQLMTEMLTGSNYVHYEISNFCLPRKMSRHNSNYWKQIPYLGLGPGAHSFDVRSRQSNISSNGKYMAEIALGKLPCKIEKLNPADRINEILLTGLRTMWGVDLHQLKSDFGWDLVQENRQLVDRYSRGGFIQIEENRLFLTDAGKLLADQISADLFLEDNDTGDQNK